MDERLREYIERKAYELIEDYNRFVNSKERFLKNVCNFNKSNYWISLIDNDARLLRESWEYYCNSKFSILQFASVLGEEYRNYLVSILRSSLDDKELDEKIARLEL